MYVECDDSVYLNKIGFKCYIDCHLFADYLRVTVCMGAVGRRYSCWVDAFLGLHNVTVMKKSRSVIC